MNSKLKLENFNHQLTLLGGQSFAWDQVNSNTYIGVFQNDVVRLTFNKNSIEVESLNNIQQIKKYLDLDSDYEHIHKQILADSNVQKAYNWNPNIRILKQPFIQTVISYLISQNNSINNIRNSTRKLSSILGNRVEFENTEHSLFPSLKQLADATDNQLKEARVGYRAPYIKQSAKILHDTDLENRIVNMSEEDIRQELLKLPGIGEKVADCILVYSIGIKDITPMDVWGKRVMKELYGISDKTKPEEYRRIFRDMFNGNAALAGQYLFEWYRNNN
jgi:N-glycosylase/DNA lyase